jgi:hypothetical protein
VEQVPSVRLQQRRATDPPKGHPRGFPVLRKMSWRMLGISSAVMGSVAHEKRQAWRVYRSSGGSVQIQSQTALVSCQKWEKRSPSVEPTSTA